MVPALLVGLLAARAASDRLWWGASEGWMARAEAARAPGSLEASVLASQRALLRGRQRASGAAPVVLLGPGRALDGGALSEALPPDTPVIDLAHGGMQPFETLCAVDDVLALEPALVLVAFCVIDTHAPLRVGVQTAPGSAAALTSLERELGPEASLAHTGLLRRLWWGARLDILRWWPLRSAPQPTLVSSHPAGDTRTPVRFPDAAGPTEAPAQARQQVMDAFPAVDAGDLLAIIRRCESVGRGRRAAAQIALLTEAVEAIVSAGVPVLLVEEPLHTSTRVLFERPLRAELLEALAPLVAHDLVSLVTEHQSGPFPPGEFDDPVRLGPPGRARLAAGLARPVRGMLPR